MLSDITWWHNIQFVVPGKMYYHVDLSYQIRNLPMWQNTNDTTSHIWCNMEWSDVGWLQRICTEVFVVVCVSWIFFRVDLWHQSCKMSMSQHADYAKYSMWGLIGRWVRTYDTNKDIVVVGILCITGWVRDIKFTAYECRQTLMSKYASLGVVGGGMIGKKIRRLEKNNESLFFPVFLICSSHYGGDWKKIR